MEQVTDIWEKYEAGKTQHHAVGMYSLVDRCHRFYEGDQWHGMKTGGEEIPAEQVKGRFLSLDYGHLEYVFDCLRRNTTQIRNIRAYLLTALYNAPVTMSPYYQAAVQHDFGP